MAQYGLLESFRNLNELSVNEYKRRASRRSLLLGDFALQFSNDVNIVGNSSIAVNKFSLKSNLDPNSNLFLSSSNVDGTVVFKELDLPSWAYSNYQHDIMIGNFSNDNKIKIPHMGWNTVKQVIKHPLWSNIEENSRFYSVHSYYVKETDSSVASGVTNYGIDFTCAVAKDNMFAVQFHPEKSQHDGLQLLKNFVNWQN